jgi:Heparinase II/III-like protein
MKGVHMKKLILTSRHSVLVFLPALMILATYAWTAADPPGKNMEPFSYREDFETNELNAWASYPLWQDTAFDPNFHVGRLAAGDPNISIIQRVTPYTNVDNYAGAQKEMDAILIPGSVIGLRYYLKTELKPEFFKVRVARPEGPVDFTVSGPPANRWEALTISLADLLRQNPGIKGETIRVTGLAFLAKFPKADPEMPIYLGLDDIVLEGARTPDFRFAEPAVHKLAEWRPYIPRKLYGRGDIFNLRGEWPLTADAVSVRVAPFTQKERPVLDSRLKREGAEWRLAPVRLDWPAGLYLGELTALQGRAKIATTEFTVFVVPGGLAGRHPRLWFDGPGLESLKKRLLEARFKDVSEEILRDAAKAREDLPLDKFYFDVDVFPKDEPLIGNVPRSIYPWFDRIRDWRAGIHDNALAYALLGDQEAGRYAAGLLIKLCGHAPWVHPWFESRGQHIYYPVAELGMDAALGYDLVFDLLDEAGRKTVRNGLWRNVVTACHRSYVEDNLVTNCTSNWAAHMTSGSVMAQASTFGDVPGAEEAEPYLTGVLLKLDKVIQKSSGRDGGYGESYGYCSFTMLSLSKSLPALTNVFGVDFSGTLDRTYQDVPWASLLEDKSFFYFGDSSGNLGPMTSWAWLLARRQDPLLGWLYRYLKKGETLMDAIYEPEKVPGKDPFDKNPVRVYRDLGTTVFRSGWTKDDFVFVLRTGPFYNHQHLDQGTFWLADRGSIFIAERHGSTYYDDPFYQSHYTQPVAHSTILIDGNEQSQRVGDPLAFIPGLEDHAFIHQFLDGESAAFVSGDIGKLYWGKIKELRRNVLYLKPRTLLMLDTVVPADKDVDVTLLYQAGKLADITVGEGGGRVSLPAAEQAAPVKDSLVRREKNTLRISHLWPPKLHVKVEETPLYINTLKEEKPLVREGLLAVTARTAGQPLVMASLLGTSPEAATPQFTPGDGHACGKLADGGLILFSTSPGNVYDCDQFGIATDALALWTGGLAKPADAPASTAGVRSTFAAQCTSLDADSWSDGPHIRSAEPICFEYRSGKMKFSASKASAVAIRQIKKPKTVVLNGQPLPGYTWDAKGRELRLTLPAGEGTLTF